jgi:hypothetical protein
VGKGVWWLLVAEALLVLLVIGVALLVSGRV